MSDLYLMEDLKYAVGLVIFNEVTNKDNVAEISKFSVRYQAKGLQKNCCQFLLPKFITDNMTSMDESLPLLVEIALKARSKSRRKGQGLSLNCQVGLNKAPIFGLEVIFIQMD